MGRDWMRAWQLPAGCTSVAQLTLARVPRPTPGPGEVLVRVLASSLNFRDQAIATGRYIGGVISATGTPLSDGAGVVEAIGPDVRAVAAGDRVAGTFFQRWLDGPPTPAFGDALGMPPAKGMLAEYVTLPETGVVGIPQSLTFEEAAALPCAGVTAWNALMCGLRPLAPGNTVLLLGTGGVSLIALAIAKAAGARVIATSSSEPKLARLRSLGADATINYVREPDWGARAAAIAGGSISHVVETVGPSTLAHSFQAVGFGGEIGLIGVLSLAGETSPMALLVKGASLRGIFVGSAAMAVELGAYVDRHRLRPFVDRVFDFEDAPAAYAYQGSPDHFGKVVIRHAAG